MAACSRSTTRQVAAVAHHGADVRLDPAGFDTGIRHCWEQVLADVEAARGTLYAIPAGASDHPLGGHAFVGWVFEVEDQKKDLGFTFDNVVVCSVTGSTRAGMVTGFAHSNRARSVRGIDASATVDQTREQILRIARRTADLIELGRPLGGGRGRPVRPVARWRDHRSGL